MNAQRRKKLREALDIIAEAYQEEEEAFNNLPGSIQESERGEKMMENCSTLEEMVSDLQRITEEP
jgi:hypothetical protein